MKKIILFAAILATTFQATAQEETLFNRAHIIGAFGAPIVQYSFNNDDFSTSVGGGGGLIIDNFFIGGYGMGTIDEDVFNTNLDRIELGHGGFWLGFTYPSHKLIHLFSSVKLGWGGVGIDFNDNFDSLDGVFVITPEAGLELNIFGFFRIAATVGYRKVQGIDPVRTGLDKDAFDNLMGGLTFRFGGFGGYHRHRDW